jgi:hypothetical protein
MYSIITSLTSKKPIKVWGELPGKHAVVLINRGSSHIFTSAALVDEEKTADVCPWYGMVV